MVVFGQSGCNRAKVVIFRKVVVFGQKCFYSSKEFVFLQK